MKRRSLTRSCLFSVTSSSLSMPCSLYDTIRIATQTPPAHGNSHLDPHLVTHHLTISANVFILEVSYLCLLSVSIILPAPPPSKITKWCVWVLHMCFNELLMRYKRKTDSGGRTLGGAMMTVFWFKLLIIVRISLSLCVGWLRLVSTGGWVQNLTDSRAKSIIAKCTSRAWKDFVSC